MLKHMHVYMKKKVSNKENFVHVLRLEKAGSQLNNHLCPAADSGLRCIKRVLPVS